MKKRVLLVDDSLTALMRSKLILDRGGYDVLTAKNGREAIEIAVASRPDLILMDVMMPEVGGIEAVRALHERKETKEIPVIMVTTRGEVECIRTAFVAGARDYVTKPVEGAELLDKIRCLLEPPAPEDS